MDPQGVEAQDGRCGSDWGVDCSGVEGAQIIHEALGGGVAGGQDMRLCYDRVELAMGRLIGFFLLLMTLLLLLLLLLTSTSTT